MSMTAKFTNTHASACTFARPVAVLSDCRHDLAVMSPVQRLEQIVRNGGADASAIDAALQSVLAARDPAVVGSLLLLLSDSANDDAMWSLLHAAESFDDDQYARDALRVLPVLNEASPRWSEIVLTRLVNSDGAREVLVRQAVLSTAERRAALRAISTRIDRANSRLASGLAELDAAIA